MYRRLSLNQKKLADRISKMFEKFRFSNLFSSQFLKEVKFNDYPPVYYENYINDISFRNIQINPSNSIKTGQFIKSLFYLINNLIVIFAVILFTISLFKDDEESIYYGNFNGYFEFENKLVLDIITGYILYFTFILKVFYTQFKIDGYEFSWIAIFRLFHKDVEFKEIGLNEYLAAKLWRSTLGLNNLAKLLIYLQVIITFIVYLFVYQNLPEYFRTSSIGYVILIVEFILIYDIFKTFESFYFLFCTVCKYLRIRVDYNLNSFNNYVYTFERKLNDRFRNDDLNKYATSPFSNDLKNEFDPYKIYYLLQEHDDICNLLKRYNYFWRFYLFATFLTMPLLIGFFVFLLTFDSNMHYIHLISLACIIIILISYFYLVTVPAVSMSSKMQETILPLKLINKYRLPMKIKYKIETYLTRFETKISFDCYHLFAITSETYMHFFIEAGSLLFLSLQLFSTAVQSQKINQLIPKNYNY